MDNSSITKDRFLKMVDKASPNSKLFTDCLRAFVTGGFICVLGEWLAQSYRNMGAEDSLAGTLASLSLMLITVILTGIGVFDRIAKFGGAGAVVPISGFANSVTAPALEYKKEGYVFGVGAKMFVIAGPVIVYGLAASSVYGVIYYLMNR